MEAEKGHNSKQCPLKQISHGQSWEMRLKIISWQMYIWHLCKKKLLMHHHLFPLDKVWSGFNSHPCIYQPTSEQSCSFWISLWNGWRYVNLRVKWLSNEMVTVLRKPESWDVDEAAWFDRDHWGGGWDLKKLGKTRGKARTNASSLGFIYYFKVTLKLKQPLITDLQHTTN